MATITPEQWLKQNSPVETSKKLSPEEYLANKSKTTDKRVPTAKVQTPEEYLKDKQITTTEKQSTLGKVAGFLAPTITKTVGKYKKGEDITARDVIGSGLEAASYLIPVGAVAKGATLAAKATKLAVSGAASGAAFNAGGSIAEGKSGGDVLKSSLIGAGIGGAAGGALGIVGAGLAARKLGQKTEAQFAEEAAARANLGPIPEASNPRLSLPAPRTPNEIPIELPGEGILQTQQKLRETPVPVQPTVERTGIAKVAEGYHSRQDFVNAQIKSETITKPVSIPKTEQATRSTKKSLTDFIKSETNFLVTTQQKIPKGYKEKLTKIWEASNKEPIVIAPNAKRTKELEDIWNEAHTVPTVKSTKLPIESTPKTPNEIPIELPSPGILESQAKLKEGQVPVTTPITKVSPTTRKIEVPTPTVAPIAKVEPVTPVLPEVKPVVTKPVSYTKDPVKSLAKTMETELPQNADPTFINTTLANQTAKYDSVASVTPTDDLIDMAMGLKPLPEGLSPVSIHALTSIRNDLTVDQAIRLKNIYPLSKAGQDLSLARLKAGAVIDNPVDMMQVIEKEMKEQVVKKVLSKNEIKNLFPDCGFN